MNRSAILAPDRYLNRLYVCHCLYFIETCMVSILRQYYQGYHKITNVNRFLLNIEKITEFAKWVHDDTSSSFMFDFLVHDFLQADM